MFFAENGDPYERPVAMELDEIVLYQQGRRVTLEIEEKSLLLKETIENQQSGKYHIMILFLLFFGAMA